MFDTITDWLSDAWDWVRYGPLEERVWFCCSADYEFVSAVRMGMLEDDASTPIRIVTGAASLTCIDDDGTEHPYDDPEPGRVLLMSVHTRRIQVSTMTFTRNGVAA
jgi:hypothetical protein